jgi:hypothetical protein
LPGTNDSGTRCPAAKNIGDHHENAVPLFIDDVDRCGIVLWAGNPGAAAFDQSLTFYLSMI